MIDERFIILAVIIGVGANLNYIYNTIKGRTKPNRVTWALWTLIPIISFFAMLSKDVEITPLIATFMSGFVPLLTLGASFLDKKAFWKISKFDYICGFLSLIGIAGWIITREGNYAIIFAIIADVLAAIPTFVKSYKFPETESWPNYLGGAISSFITLLTIKHWTFASTAWTLDILIMCSILFVLIKFRVGPSLQPASYSVD
jgi:hypothetical protein